MLIRLKMEGFDIKPIPNKLVLILHMLEYNLLINFDILPKPKTSIIPISPKKR
jgi:hypothetical protein